MSLVLTSSWPNGDTTGILLLYIAPNITTVLVTCRPKGTPKEIASGSAGRIYTAWAG